MMMMMMMMPSILSAIALLLPALALVDIVEGLGIPGTSHTVSGYDTEGGDEPICWRGRSDLAALTGGASIGTDGGGDDNGNGDGGGGSEVPSRKQRQLRPQRTEQRQRQRSMNAVQATPWDNKLYKSFILTGEVDLLPQCPRGLYIEGDVPTADVEIVRDDVMLRTGEFHDYNVRLSIDLDVMGGDYVFSDEGPRIAVQIILCQVDQGLCTPFVHEHANDRLKVSNITENLATGDRHGNTHVHSPAVFITLPDPSAGGPQVFDVAVPTRVNDPGSFFAITAYQVFTADGESMQQYRYDVSNALNTRLVTYQDPAQILSVTKTMQIVVAVLIGLSVAVLAYILFQTIKYRKTRVMQLSQAPFLVMSRIAAIAATLCTFLFNPKTDMYCRLRDPLVLIPLQIIYAVMIGRLWRISVVISPLLTIAIDKDKDNNGPRHWSSMICRKFFSGLTKVSQIGDKISCRGGSAKRHSLSKGPLRSKVTNFQLGKVVLLFTIPQIVIQILALVLQPSQLAVTYNNDLSVGRTVCSPQDTNASSLSVWGWYILLLFFLLILFLAYESRMLPSLFNETPAIFNTVLTSIIVIAVGLATIRLSESPTTSPDVAYLLRVLIVMTMTLTVSLRIMLPKIRLARSGKPILINKLVTDHRIASQSSLNTYDGSSGRISAAAAPSYNSQNSNISSSRIFSSQMSKDSVSRDEFVDESQDLEAAPANASANGGKVVASDDSSPHVHFADKEAVGPSSASPNDGTVEAADADTARHLRCANQEAGRPPAAKTSHSLNGHHRRHSSRTIRIDDKHAPSRSLILKMIETQKTLGDVSHDINSGYAISHEEWSNLREACVELGTFFRDGVEFSWEQHENNEENPKSGAKLCVGAGTKGQGAVHDRPSEA